MVSENLKRVSSDAFIRLGSQRMTLAPAVVWLAHFTSRRLLTHSILPLSYHFRLLLEVGIIDE